MRYQVHFFRAKYHLFSAAMLCGLRGCSLESLENHNFNMSGKSIGEKWIRMVVLITY